MKLLKPGREQNGFSAELVCSGAGNGGGGCGATLLVEQDDFYQHTSYDYGGGSDFYVLFRCNQCGVWTDVDQRRNPVPFAGRLKKYTDYGKQESGDK